MMTSKLRKFMVAVVACVATLPALVAQEQMPQLPIDKEVKVGKLDNGLTYFIRKNKHPEGRAHFYISQKVGSMQEEESQRGLAHFLEHIAFNGTKNFPGKSMINWLETIGVKFGANLNAYTGFDETVYQIMNAPTARQSTVDSCLLILHDWSAGISLLDKEIDDERGVIQEEWRQRDNGNMRVMGKMLEDAFPTHRYGQRMPIGLMSVVRNFKYDELRAYYKKWYRPDLQALVIVGDIDPEKVEATIKRQFADVPKPVNPAPRTYDPVPVTKGIWASVATDKEAVGTNISVNFLSDAMPREMTGTMAGLAENYIRSVVSSVLNERFDDMVKKPNAPFLSAYANLGSFIVAQTKDAVTFSATSADGEYQKAYKALVAEIERIAKYGINKGEYERAKKNLLVSLKKSYDERNNRKNGAYAQEYSNYFTQGGYIPGIEVEYQMHSMMAEQIPVEVLNQMLNQALSAEDDIFISLTGPAKDGIVYPTKEALIAQYKEYRQQKVEPLKEEISNTQLLDTKPKAGKVIKESKGQFGSTVWTLSNGVEVIIKPTDFKEDEIRFSAQRPGGLYTFAKKDALEARVINNVMNRGGLGKFDDSALDKALTGRLASAGPSIGSTSESISGSATKADLETMMQLIYLNFTQKRSDKEAYAAWLEKAINMRKMSEANPMASLGDSVVRAIYPKDAKDLVGLTEAEYKAINYERVMQMYRERFGNAHGFKFVFVGNIDLKTFRPLVESYLASLPAKAGTAKPDLSRYPVARKGQFQNHYTKKLETPMGFVFNYYSGKLPANRRNRMVFNILSDILDQVYVETIREREGGTYGASTSTSLSYEPKDDASLTVSFQTDPEKAKRLNEVVNEELQRIVKEGAEQAKFDKVIANYEKSFNEQQKENGYWLGQLMAFYYHKRDGVTGYLELLKSIKPAEVGVLLKQLLDQGNTVEVMMLPEATK